jgi:hypothetical protein
MAPNDEIEASALSTRDIALMALLKIQSHEKTCSDRYRLLIQICGFGAGGIFLQILAKVAAMFKIVTLIN